MILLTTTAMEIDEELMNRAWCSRWTRTAGRRTPSTSGSVRHGTCEGGLAQKRRAASCAAPKRAALAPSALVVNPYARRLTFQIAGRGRGGTT